MMFAGSDFTSCTRISDARIACSVTGGCGGGNRRRGRRHRSRILHDHLRRW